VPNFVYLKKTQFLPWTLAFNGVANWQEFENAEHGCTTTNIPLSNGIKIVSVLQCFHGKIGHTNSDIQKRDRQTKRQTDKKLETFLAAPAVGETEPPPNLAW